jgi:broad specificity phosphatase PhoE
VTHAYTLRYNCRVTVTIYLVRHGSTEWSVAHRHTGATDLPLTERGLGEVESLGARLRSESFATAMSSPLLRARTTAEMCADDFDVVDDLTEWDYGDYEGLTSAEIRQDRPDWNLWTHGCPGGETFEDVARRAKSVLGLVPPDGRVLVVAHGHFNRVLTECFVYLAGLGSKLDTAAPASLSNLGFDRYGPVVKVWNDTAHLR